MHAHRVDVLDGAHDDGVVGRVAHHLQLVFVPAQHALFHQDLLDRALTQALFDLGGELVGRTGDAAAGAAERVGRPDHERQPELGGRVLCFGERGDDGTARHLEADRLHGGTELRAVLGATDDLGVGADHLDAPQAQHTLFVELHGQVERRLST